MISVFRVFLVKKIRFYCIYICLLTSVQNYNFHDFRVCGDLVKTCITIIKLIDFMILYNFVTEIHVVINRTVSDMVLYALL